ncbi:oxidoreductase C-terminal domain-containing protein [Streptomyces akebiae]|uniref:Ferredoxin reductase n=1 Tax=Streptomyces akebiae TaxID=2865673 RepID=A0ABX8XJD2_9ACTN|nr:oxidoreductase C-terminal domain-containing protein [Streptomyces akebiae]QYX75777.1 ferredoxin reductase [Streptomyces akebiae]
MPRCGSGPLAAARDLLAADPHARKAFAPVPYFWSDQYGMKVQAYGWLRGHGEVAIVDGGPAERRFVAVYRADDRGTGALAVGMPPKAIRRWRQAIASGAGWRESLTPTRPAVSEGGDHGGTAVRAVA